MAPEPETRSQLGVPSLSSAQVPSVEPLPISEGGVTAVHGRVATPRDRPDVSVFTDEEMARGRRLRRAQTPPLLAGRGAELALLACLGLTPAGARVVEAVGGPWWARVLGGTALLVTLGHAVRLPFLARVRVVRRRFGLVT